MYGVRVASLFHFYKVAYCDDDYHDDNDPRGYDKVKKPILLVLLVWIGKKSMRCQDTNETAPVSI